MSDEWNRRGSQMYVLPPLWLFLFSVDLGGRSRRCAASVAEKELPEHVERPSEASHALAEISDLRL